MLDPRTVRRPGSTANRLVAVLGVTLTVMVAEVIGGLLSGSLALLADAGHMLTDAAGITMALLASTLAGRPATLERTFGYQRAEILAAVIHALLLFAVAAFVLVEAARRLSSPPDVSSTLMLTVAAVGLVANAGSLLLLRGAQADSLNVRGAYLEVLGDLLGSAAVLIAALVIATTGFLRADVIASALIGLMILPRTWRLLREAVDVLLEATPKGVDMVEVRDHMSAVPGIVDVHDLHAWTITSGVPALSAHVVVADGEFTHGARCLILDRLTECLSGHFDVSHCTFQLETIDHRDHEASYHR